MEQIHCHICGGFIGDERGVAYRLPVAANGRIAEPRSALCECDTPVVYGPPAGHMSSPGMPAMGFVRGLRPSGAGRN